MAVPRYDPFNSPRYQPTSLAPVAPSDALSPGARSLVNRMLTADRRDPLDDEIRTVNERRTNLRFQREAIDAQRDDFLARDGSDLFETDALTGKVMKNPNGSLVPKLGAEIEALRTRAQGRTGLLAGAFSPSKQAGDPSNEALAAQRRLAEIEPIFRLKMEKLGRIESERKRIDDLDKQFEQRLGELGRAREARYTVTPQDVASAVTSVNTARKMTGKAPVKPTDLSGPTMGTPAVPSIPYPREAMAAVADPATGQPLGTSILPEAVSLKARQMAVANGTDPIGAETLELANLRDQGITMVGNRLLADVLAERGGDEAVATVKTLETVKKLNNRLVQIDNDLPNAGEKMRGRLDRERAVVAKLLEQKQGLIDVIPTGERIKSALGSLISGLAEIPAGLSEWIAVAANKIDQKLEEVGAPEWMQSPSARGRDDGGRVEDLATAQIAKAIRDVVAEIAPKDPRLAEEFWSTKVPNAVGTMAGFLGPGLATKSRYLVPMVTGGMVGGASGYQDAIAHGASEDEAFASFLLNTGVGTSEILPVSRMLNRLDKVSGGGVKRALIEAGKEGFEEAVQETFQTTAGNVIAQQLYDENRELFEGAGEAGAVGGVTGVLMSAVISALPGKQRGGGPANSPKEPKPEGGGASEIRQEEEGQGAQVLTPPAAPAAVVDVVTPPAAAAESREAAAPERDVTLDAQAPKSFQFTNAKGDTTIVEAVRESQAIAKLPDEFGPIHAVKRIERPAEKIEGEKIDREWSAFSPESKTLGIPRAEMPQVKAEHRGALTNFLRGRDIMSEETEVRPTEVKPTQAEYSPAKVKKARDFKGGDRAILVSQDNYVVDGHHQWMAKLTDAPDELMRVIRIDAPIRDVLAQMKEFPSVESAGGATGGQTLAGQNVASTETASTLTPGSAAPRKAGRGSGEVSAGAAPAPTTAASISKRTPTVARGSNKPAKFIQAVATAGGLKAKDKATRFLQDFAPRLHKANAKAFEQMEVHVLSQAEWDADPTMRRQTPDSSAAYEPGSNTLFLNADKLKGDDGVEAISAVVHEAGHFAEHFALGEAMTQREWEKLTHAQRVEAAFAYDQRADIGRDPVELLKNRRARSEWVAMQFARVVRGETDQMPKNVVEKLKTFLETVRELVRKWVGAKSLTTAELDSWILDKLGYAKRAEQRRVIGTNAKGQNVEEDANGVRSIVENGFKITEPVQLIPTREGVVTSVNPDTRGDRFKSVESQTNTPEKSDSSARPTEGYRVSPAMQALGDELFGTPPTAREFNQKFDPSKIESANRFVSMIVRDMPTVRSRAALADFITERFPKARPYSEAIFKILGGFTDLDESGTFAEIYAAIDNPAPVSPAAEPAPAPETGAPEQSYGEKSVVAAEEIGKAITEGRALTWRDLFAITDKAFGGTQAAGAYTVKDAYDAMELAVNKWIVANAPDVRVNQPKVAAAAVERLKSLLKLLPTQTKRTAEMDAMQQFSTPPPLAYAANWVADLRASDVYLEPSAGTGGLLSFGRAAGVKTIIANELSDRRYDILRESGIPDTIFPYNAESLEALLWPRFKSGAIERPTVVVMNPPFSNGAESGKRKDTKIGAKHVEEALKTLVPGGRLVAIVGEGMAFGKPTFTQWWAGIRKKYNVRANIGVSGAEYAKYGTTFDNQLLVIDKTGPTAAEPIQGNVAKVEELFTLLEGVRNDRSQNAQATERPAAQSGGKAGAEGGGNVTAGTSVGGDAAADVGDVNAGRGERTGRPAADIGPLVEQPGTAGEGAGSAGEGADAGRNQDGQPSGDSGADRARAGTDTGEQSGLTVGRQEPQGARPAANDEAVFSEYAPAKAKVEGAISHPTPLVESAAMAAVQPPDPVYVPNLPKDIAADGKLSDAQFENVIYAGQAHTKFLADGARRGYFIGDGTGVGKGRQIAAIILDNWRQGRKRALWMSKTGTLADDARRDMRDIGLKEELLIPINKAAKSGTGKISIKEGIVFSTYTSLAKEHEGLTKDGTIRKKNPDKKTRLEQIVEWVGTDFDGVIAFDEAHMAGNAVAMKTTRGVKDPSNTGIAVVDLQKMLPKARIVYVSATGATEVSNLSYADRLGIWGPRTPFPTKLDFFDKISAGGVSAMEIVARDLKSLGSYLARTLSFNGVKFESLQQTLTPEQTQLYDQIADGWQFVFQNMDKAMSDTNANKNPRARSAARSAFFGAQQRFFNQLLTAMEMPSVIRDIRATLDAGQSAVLQLVNTNEATQDREIARATTEESADLEDLDLSPKDILLQYVDKSFPTTLYQEVQDPNNAERTMWAPVTDENGQPVQDPSAVERKNDLLLRIQTLNVPENPLEMVLNEFGHEAVAEITGRSQRIVTKKKDDGTTGRVLESNRSEARRKIEAQEFQDGKRRILVFSGAGGTGFSYHASRKAKNQQLRVHYLVQAGWRADAALQGFGRTHRSDQAQPPLYKLVTTDIQGHKRFISTIARRLAQLGALTAGERQAAGQGLFSEKDNLESKYADDALTRFFFDLYGSKITGLDFGELTKQMGFGYSTGTGEQAEWKSALIDPKTGELFKDKLPTIQQFLNRLLALRPAEQNRVFGEFFSRLEQRIENAKADGTYDPGTQTYRAAQLTKVGDEVVYRHPDSTAETRLVDIEASDPATFLDFDEIGEIGASPVERYVKNLRSGHVYALKEGPPRTDSESGAVVDTFRRIGTHGQVEIHPRTDFSEEKYETLTDESARAAWDQEIESAPKMHSRREHFIVGSFLPIWDRIKIDSPKIFRFTTNEGETMLGALIPPKQVDAVRKRLGAAKTEKSEAQIIKSIIEDGQSHQLANGWWLRRVRVSGELRIEVTGLGYRDTKDFTDDIGGFSERIGYTTRFFMPTEGARATEAMKRLLEKSPIAESGGDTLGTPPTEPASTYQYTIQRPQEFEGIQIPGFVQVDELRDGRGVGSLSIEEAQTRGLPVPPETLGTGKFTLDQVQRAIAGEILGTPPIRGTPTQEAVLAKVTGTLEDKRTLLERFRDYLGDLRDYVATELKQKLLDQFASIKRLERDAFGVGAKLDASVSAYKAARLTKNLPSVMDFLMKHGQLEYRAGSFSMKQGGKGLMQVFRPLIDAGTLRLWEGYAAAFRANRLLAEGKETNFGRTFNPATGQWSWDAATAQREIDDLLALGAQYPEFEQVRQEYVAFQSSILDVAEASGLINADQRATWEKSDYVPFYRITESLDGKGPRKRRGIAGQRSGIRQLKGGAAPVAIMENIVRNIESLVDASFKNVAMQRVADLAESNNDMLVRIPYKAVPFRASVAEVLDTLEKAGVDTSGISAEEADEFVKFWRMRAPKGKDVVSVMVDGKPIYYRVKDAPLLRSVQSMGPRVHSWWMNALMAPKNALTKLVTLDPAFMAANTIRDSFSAWVIADTPIKPGLDSAKGFVKSLRNDPSKLAVMAAGGGSGHYNNLRGGAVRDYIRQLTPAQRKTFLESIVDTPKKLGRIYADIGRATENANRIAIAESVKKRGGTDAEAAFQALDIMDFGLRGDSDLLNFFLDTVPFLNARIQGLYRLGRGLNENPKRVATHGAIIMGATVALLAANWDDDRYWELPEWERDIYYHFWLGDQHIRIPKPFEVGQIFSTIPERLFEYVGKTGDGELLAKRMLSMVGDTFAMNPLPQAAKPLAERAMNLNTFTGRPIISRGDEFKQPEQQFNVMTSETVREIADTMPDWAPEWMRSPKTLEHFIRGYLGTVGMYALTGADAITRAATSAPDDPEVKATDWWVMKRFAPSSDTRETKYVGQFYDLYQEITGLVREIKELQVEEPEQARTLASENADLLRAAPRVQGTYRVLQGLRKQQEQVFSGSASPAEKRRQLANIAARRNQAAQAAVFASPRRPSPVFNPFGGR